MRKGNGVGLHGRESPREVMDSVNSPDQSAYEALVVGTLDCRTAGGSSGWQRLQ